MNAPPFPLNPATGERFGNWVWNGTRWVSSRSTGVQVVTQVFTTVGQSPYQPSPGLITAVVETVGGGGGGGGAVASANIPTVAGWAVSGGGGGSGGYSRKTLPAALVLGGVVVTVGPGGTAGVGGQSGTAGTGGATSFGAFCSANGGYGGQNGDIAVNAWGGPGGRAPAGIGDIAAAGSAGSIAVAYYYATGGTGEPGVTTSGAGGVSFFGGGGQNWLATTGQSPGVNGQPGLMGSGGDGGCSGTSTAPANGGAGGPGICIVTEYCWGDVNDDDCSVCPPGQTLNVNARLQLDPSGGWCPPGQGQRPNQPFGPYGGPGDDES